MPTRRRFFGGALGGLAALVVAPKMEPEPVSVPAMPEETSGYAILQRLGKQRNEMSLSQLHQELFLSSSFTTTSASTLIHDVMIDLSSETGDIPFTA